MLVFSRQAFADKVVIVCLLFFAGTNEYMYFLGGFAYLLDFQKQNIKKNPEAPISLPTDTFSWIIVL